MPGEVCHLCQPGEQLQQHVTCNHFLIKFLFKMKILIKFSTVFCLRDHPILYDYIWHRSNGQNKICTNDFDVRLTFNVHTNIFCQIHNVFNTVINFQSLRRCLCWSGKSLLKPTKQHRYCQLKWLSFSQLPISSK